MKKESIGGRGAIKRSKIVSIALCALMIVTVFGMEFSTEAFAQVTEEWTARYNGPADNYDNANDITVGPSGNVYVTGTSAANSDFMNSKDFVTAAYDASGNDLWVARYDSPYNGDDIAEALAVDRFENIYVTGHSKDNRYTGNNYTTIKYDSSGNELWVATYDGPAYLDDQALAIALDSFGNAYVTGKSHDWVGILGGPGESDYDCATIKYDPSGSELWVARYNGPGILDADCALDIVVEESSGNVYVTGFSRTTFSHPPDVDDYITVAYDPNGNELWNATYNGPGNGKDCSNAIAVDSWGNIYVTGASDSNTSTDPGAEPNMDCTTIKYDSSGSELWVARYNGPGDFDDYGTALAIDESGYILVTGNCDDNNWNRSDYLTIKYDRDGNGLWTAIYDGSGEYWDRAIAIALDSEGNAYVTGRSSCDRSWYPYDIATVAYDPSGSELWVERYNGPGNSDDMGTAIAADPYGNVYVTGSSCGGGVYYDAYDYVTIKYSQEGFVRQAKIDIDPDTLNLKSKGRWITCYIDIPDYDVNDIDITTIMLEGVIPAKWGDVQGTTLMVKFDRSEVEDYIGTPHDSIELTVTGEFFDGNRFEGGDTIRVMEPR